MRARAIGIVAVALLAFAGTANAQTTLINESFRNGDVVSDDFVVGGNFKPCLTASQNLNQQPIPGCSLNSPSLPQQGDREGVGALRLTGNAGSLAGFLLYQDRMPFTAGLDVTFDFFAYNGTGADGFSFFIADGSADLRQPGAPGGSLGYAQRNSEQGLAGGFAGIGVDEYGNFGNDAEGRGAGCSPPSAGTSLWPDRVSLRGPGSGTTGYCLVRRSGVLAVGSLDFPNKTDRDDGVRRQIRLRMDPPSAPGAAITVSLGGATGGLTEEFSAPLPANPPATFKFGFAASTGGSTNIHEIRGLKVDSVIRLPRLVMSKTQDGPYTTGGSGTFTLTAGTAAGADDGPATTPITVTDRLPAGRLAAPPTGTGWDCSASSGADVSCTRAAAIVAPGTTLPAITVPVAFDTSTSGRFTNVAEVDSLDNANTPAQSRGSAAFRVLPLGADDAATTSVGVEVGIQVLANDFGNLDPTTLETSSPGHGRTLWSSTGRILTYVPDPGFSGLDTFTYTVADHSGQAITQTVRLTVTPRAVDDAATTDFQTPVTINVLANDHGSFVPGSIVLVSGPPNGSVSFDAQGRAVYTPNNGFSGQDSFVYRVLDGAGQPATATVVVTVGEQPPSPTPPPAAQLVVTKTADRQVVRLGEEVTYRVVVANRGDGPAEEVRVVDSPDLPAEVESISVSQGSCQAGPPPACELGTIEPGERVTITVVVRPTAAGVLLNGVAVTAVTEDTVRRDNVDVAGVVVVSRAASVRVTKTASRRRLRVGREVLFDIRVRSNGRHRALRVRTCDVLPRGLELVRAPVAQSVNGRRVCWRRRQLPRGEVLRYQVLARARSIPQRRSWANTAVVRGLNFATRRARARVVVAGDPRLGACAARLPVARAAC